MTNTLYKAYISEQYKLSKNKQIFGLLLLPALVILLVDAYIVYQMSESVTPLAVINPWKVILGRYVFQFYYLLYPIMVAIFVFACCEVEYKNNNYKVLFTIPIAKSKIFFSKAIFILLVVLGSILIAYAVFLLSGYGFSLFYPEIGFQNFDYRKVIFLTFLKLFFTLSAIAMIQFALSLIFKSFMYPIGFSMFMLVFSLLIVKKKFSDFIPYTGSFKSMMNLLEENDTFARLDYSNIGMVFLFMLISFFLFKRQNVN